MNKNNQNKVFKGSKLATIFIIMFSLFIAGIWMRQFLKAYSPFFEPILLVSNISLFGILILIIACPLLSIGLILGKKRFLVFTVEWLILAFVVFSIPRVYDLQDPNLIKASMALDTAGPDKVREEARQLIKNFTPPALDERYKDASSEYKEFLTRFQKIKKEDLPPAIKQLKPAWVRVYKDEVEIKIYGLGDFAGYIISFDKELDHGEKLKDNIYWYAGD